MPRNDVWTEEEKGRLKSLYSCETEFEEIVVALPGRTLNAIRMKASRLGLRRPIVLELPSQPSMLLCIESGRSNGYVLSCSDCGNWIHLKGSGPMICSECGATCRLIT